MHTPTDAGQPTTNHTGINEKRLFVATIVVGIISSTIFFFIWQTWPDESVPTMNAVPVTAESENKETR